MFSYSPLSPKFIEHYAYFIIAEHCNHLLQLQLTNYSSYPHNAALEACYRRTWVYKVNIRVQTRWQVCIFVCCFFRWSTGGWAIDGDQEGASWFTWNRYTDKHLTYCLSKRDRVPGLANLGGKQYPMDINFPLFPLVSIWIFHFHPPTQELWVPSKSFTASYTHGQGWHFCRQKMFFCHLPILTGLNRQKVAENDKNENDPLAHFTCFLKPVNTSICNTWSSG